MSTTIKTTVGADHEVSESTEAAHTERTASMFARYETGLSLAAVGVEFGVTASVVYYAFQKLGYKTRPPGRIRDDRPVVWFDGIPYSPGRDGYYVRRGCGSGPSLHRAVWISHNGPIPDGHHIHHRDRDKSNNDIGNLECHSPADHSRFYDPGCNGRVHYCDRPPLLKPRTHCPHGHEFTPENTLMKRNGHRQCRECKRADSRRRYLENKASGGDGRRRRVLAEGFRQAADVVQGRTWDSPDEIIKTLRVMADRLDPPVGGAA